MEITSRPYRDTVDLDRMKEFLMAAAGADSYHGYFHIGDLLWGMYQNTVFDPRRGIRLWEAGDELVGFMWSDVPGIAFLQVHPRLRGKGVVEHEMLAWLEALHLGAFEQDDEPGRWIGVRAMEGVPAEGAFLVARGYRRDSFFMYHRKRELGEPIASPLLPAGYSVRAVGDEAEWHERVETHREVWHPSRVTLEAYRRLRAAPGYLPDLDLVVVAPDGHFAAYCLCWLDPVNKTGEFEPVGTRPAYRGLGLGKAVMLEGLRRLRAHGARTALVFSVGDNEASNKLYDAVGLLPIDKDLFYSKRVE